MTIPNIRLLSEPRYGSFARTASRRIASSTILGVWCKMSTQSKNNMQKWNQVKWVWEWFCSCGKSIQIDDDTYTGVVDHNVTTHNDFFKPTIYTHIFFLKTTAAFRQHAKCVQLFMLRLKNRRENYLFAFT